MLQRIWSAGSQKMENIRRLRSNRYKPDYSSQFKLRIRSLKEDDYRDDDLEETCISRPLTALARKSLSKKPRPHTSVCRISDSDNKTTDIDTKIRTLKSASVVPNSSGLEVAIQVNGAPIDNIEKLEQERRNKIGSGQKLTFDNKDVKSINSNVKELIIDTDLLFEISKTKGDKLATDKPIQDGQVANDNVSMIISRHSYKLISCLVRKWLVVTLLITSEEVFPVPKGTGVANLAFQIYSIHTRNHHFWNYINSK
jgi:hypothetical protein